MRRPVGGRRTASGAWARHTKTLELMVVACGVVGLLSGRSVGAADDARAAKVTIVHYDPDANYQAIPRIIASLEEYLSEELGPVSVVGAPDVPEIRRRVEQTGAAFAILPDSVVDTVHALKLKPVVRPERGGQSSYRKVLVARQGIRLESLSRARIATADIGARGDGRSGFLSRLAAGGADTSNAEVLPLSKDVDALFALTVGQADAALVTRESVALLRDLDPNTASSLTELWVSPPRAFAALCIIGDGGGDKTRASMLRAFAQMHQSAKGKEVLDLASYDRWVPVHGGTP